MSATAKIQLSNVRKAFGEKQVLNGVDLFVQRGESLVVIGGSGTGKSVLIKSILGLIRPDAGEILVDGESMIGLNARERQEAMRKFGMLFQGGALFDSLSVWENIAFSLVRNQRMPKKQAKEYAIEKLKRVGLPADVARLSPSELSGGMQKRVALARAIAHKPEIIFFDEPTTGLDPIMADVINELIVECSQELGATTITITHDMASARSIATHVIMLHGGQVIWRGLPTELETSGNARVDQFVHGRAHGPMTDGA